MDTTIEVLGGRTVRFEARDYTSLSGTPITSATDMTINLCDQNGNIVDEGTVHQEDAPNNDTYYADLTIPLVKRKTRYLVQYRHVYNSQVFEGQYEVWALPFLSSS